MKNNEDEKLEKISDGWSDSPVSKRQGIICTAVVAIMMFMNGMDMMMLSLSTPLLIADMGLTEVQAGSLASVSELGVTAGIFLSGMISRKLGKVKTLTLGYAIFGLGTGIIGFMDTYEIFLCLRFLTGLGLGSIPTVGMVIVSEYVPSNNRSLATAIVNGSWPVGYVCVSALSAYILPNFGWQWLFRLAFIPVVLAIFVIKIIPEPAKTEEAKAMGTGKAYKLLLTKHRKIVLALAVGAFFTNFASTGAYSWVPTWMNMELGVDIGSIGLIMTVANVFMAIGEMLPGVISDKLLGRRRTWVLTSLLAFIFVPLVIFFGTAGNISILLIGLTFVYVSPQGVFPSYCTESFPSSIRGEAYSLAWGIGRFGSVFAPIVIGAIASNYTIAIGMIIAAATYIISAAGPGIFVKDKLYDAANE